MTTIIHSTVGLTHLLSALLSLILGTLVLLTVKGSPTHKRIGYAYTFSMIILNVTAFSIYRLFHGFGPFHIAAIVSFLTLMMGFIPVLVRKPAGSWIHYHISGMYYSVIGLYAAFVSELVVRIPGAPFFTLVAIGTAIVMAVGIFIFQFKRKTWIAQNQPLERRHKSVT
ncbi:MAG TPA: DUF2306 domain-containing protein [Cyclobacteriaceae bacterium]